MSTPQKADLVERVWQAHGLAPALAAVELPKSTWYYHRQCKVSYKEKYAHLRPLMEVIARDHPSYGLPRITIELWETYHQVINHRVVQKLLQVWDLILPRSTRVPRPHPIRHAFVSAGKRANLVAQMDRIGLFEVAYTDFTELVYADGRRKAYLMPILGHLCKLVHGWAVGERANTTLALEAWTRARATLRELGVCVEGMIVHRDQDSIYTGYGWTGQMLADRLRLSYALNGAKDNPEMESFNRRFKTERRSLFLDAQSLGELRAIVDQRIHYYNSARRHSSLNYRAPLSYLERVRPSVKGQTAILSGNSEAPLRP